MTRDQAKSELLHFVQIVSDDINQLKELADDVAAKEFEDLQKQHRIQMPTMVREGPNDDPQTYLRGRCIVPLTMACFAAMDFIGSVLMFARNMNDTTKDSFYLHARIFLNQLLQRADIDRSNRGDLIQKVYRNNVMHSYLPVGDGRIGYGCRTVVC